MNKGNPTKQASWRWTIVLTSILAFGIILSAFLLALSWSVDFIDRVEPLAADYGQQPYYSVIPLNPAIIEVARIDRGELLSDNDDFLRATSTPMGEDKPIITSTPQQTEIPVTSDASPTVDNPDPTSTASMSLTMTGSPTPTLSPTATSTAQMTQVSTSTPRPTDPRPTLPKPTNTQFAGTATPRPTGAPPSSPTATQRPSQPPPPTATQQPPTQPPPPTATQRPPTQPPPPTKTKDPYPAPTDPPSTAYP